LNFAPPEKKEKENNQKRRCHFSFSFDYMHERSLHGAYAYLQIQERSLNALNLDGKGRKKKDCKMYYN